ncbi:GMC oxidoreductase [Neptunicella marina]|uniref:Cholesterol oxidase n=1 Tax=Neptunicella marina TaxID=2125989 RepID=A0A8J6IR84_9ALTE|nr:GMC oxidoreductase [Neptunicella marina]MBC3765346.1 GMC family oxidoreductase [Neptunicella marina]
MASTLDHEAIVIGSGFGGSISACRLAKKWPGKVLLLERGKRYPMGSFPRKPHDMATNFWNIKKELRKRPGHVRNQDMHGMFDVRFYKHMDAVVCAGLGGGSLIYANVFLQPPDEVFDENWPVQCKKQDLQHYYQTARSVLGARPIPAQTEPGRKVVRTDLFKQFAESEGRQSELVDINVFFGNDFEKPLPIGVQQPNRYGAIQTSCVYCAECDVGCNTHSKNTTDLNYLHVAEHKYKASIKTEQMVEKIVPLNADGRDDSEANGEFGYRVYWYDLTDNQVQCSATTRRVVVSAGTLGTNEILLRCRDSFKTLPHINQHLGQHFSGNGDFLSFVIDGNKPADPNYGPVITQKTDFNLFSDFDRSKAFILEDASYPNFAAWYTEGMKPVWAKIPALYRGIKRFIQRFLSGRTNGSVADELNELLKDDMSYRSAVLLCMGIDNSQGQLTLDKRANININWPRKQNMPLYQAILAMGERFKRFVGGKHFFPLPNWWWPKRSNVTVHALGGCRLADNPGRGVTSADSDSFGQVFGYPGLYVADGSLLPTAVGANPVATISALSEKVAEGITGIKPDPSGEL